jgi:hypothetical protein
MASLPRIPKPRYADPLNIPLVDSSMRRGEQAVAAARLRMDETEDAWHAGRATGKDVDETVDAWEWALRRHLRRDEEQGE